MATKNDKMSPWVLILFLALSSSLWAQTKAKLENLPERHRRWITEEVNYIITPVEKDVFLELKNERERELFIEAFWKNRDPTQGTEENEFRVEHYKRLDHANRRFRGTGRPGWKTDRGKVYILLGEPMSQRSFFGTDAYYPAEQWNYQGLEGTGLPQGFSLLFFRKGRIGDYVLYDPAGDGPWSLLSNYQGNPGDYWESYAYLSDIEPELANLSISLIPGEAVANLPSMTSSMLLRDIDVSAIKKVEDRYAAKFREFKDIIEVEYSTNYIESEAHIQIIQDRSGIYYVHYSIQPHTLSMGSYENSVYTNLEFNGMITDDQGFPVFQFENTVPIRFNEAQFKQMRHRPFSFTDKFPLIPGDYKFSLILKNAVSKEFTSFDSTIRIPADIPTPQMSPLLLGFNVTKPSTQKDMNKPFVVDDVQLYSQSSNSFIPSDNLFVYFQIAGLPEEKREQTAINYRIYREDTEIFSATHPLEKYQDGHNVIEMIPLEKFIPGYCRIQVALLDEAQNELTSHRKNFIILTAATLPRPWVIGRSLIDSGETQIDYTLGRQLLNKKDYTNALIRLEQAYHQNPTFLNYGLYLAQTNYYLDRYQDALKILEPLQEMGKDNFEFNMLQGQAYQALGQFAEAIKIFDSALDQFGLSSMLLNPLGECYYRLGNARDALAAFEKSLEIDPGQDDIQERVASLKK